MINQTLNHLVKSVQRALSKVNVAICVVHRREHAFNVIPLPISQR